MAAARPLRPDGVAPRPDGPFGTVVRWETGHEAVRHRRRRVHRLELRPPRARHDRRRGHGLRRCSPTPATSPPSATWPTTRATASSTATSATATPSRAAMDGHDAVVHFAAESHVDRSIVDPDVFVRTNCDGTNVMCDVARQVGVERFLHISTDEVYGSIERRLASPRPTRSSPRSPYSASKAGSDLIALVVPRDVRPAGGGHPLVEQLRAVPVPREGHPAVRHQPARRAAGAALRRRPQRARLVLRRRQLRRRRPRAAARARSARSTTSARATRSPTASSPSG